MSGVVERQYGSVISVPFGEDSLQVFDRAEQEAVKHCHSYVGTEHLLLAVVKGNKADPAMVTLKNLGVDPKKIADSVEFIIGQGDTAPHHPLSFTPRGRRVLEMAISAAMREKALKTNTRHLLIGFIGEGEGIAAGILENLKISWEKLQNVISEPATEQSKPSPKEVVSISETLARLQAFMDNPKVNPLNKAALAAGIEEAIYYITSRENQKNLS